ncbi:rod shape-determining protein, partial [Bacillus altitudinis]|uniref:rod shape-determining protein n=1 Tax=Bacillus altitudinis TaxID=293387 RepID=UPI003B51764B
MIEGGVMISGGGGVVKGVDELVGEEVKVGVLVGENGMDCVGVGSGVMLDK